MYCSMPDHVPDIHLHILVPDWSGMNHPVLSSPLHSVDCPTISADVQSVVTWFLCDVHSHSLKLCPLATLSILLFKPHCFCWEMICNGSPLAHMPLLDSSMYHASSGIGYFPSSTGLFSDRATMVSSDTSLWYVTGPNIFLVLLLMNDYIDPDRWSSMPLFVLGPPPS